MQLATWLKTPSLHALEIARAVGFKVIVLDLEHGFQSVNGSEPVTALGRSMGLTMYSRIGMADRLSVQLALDFGSHGVIIPQIENLDHAREVCGYAKYPPLGSRGLGSNRTMKYGGVDDAFLATENARTKCFPMIESPGALRDGRAIAALDTVDGLFIGPGDLSLSRGRGNFAFQDADREDFATVVAACANAGKSWAAAVFADGVLEWCAKNGAEFGVITSELAAIHAGLQAALLRAQTTLSAGP